MAMTSTILRFALLSALTLTMNCTRNADMPATEKSPAPDWRTAIEEWEEDDPIPDVPLINHEGGTFQLADLDGQHILIGFIFSRCPNPKACPLTMQRFQAVQKAWAAARESGSFKDEELHLLVVTLDPEFDTPAGLKSYGEVYGADLNLWTLATGESELVAKELPSLFNVIALKRGDGDINHGVKVALLGPGRVPLQEWPDNEFTAQDVLDLIGKKKP